MKTTWTVSNEHEQKRFDVFLSETIEGLTRSQAKKRIEAGAYLVNGKRVSGHHFLKTGDTVTQREEPPEAPQTVSHRRTKTDTVIASSQLHIIEETEDWIVLDKPFGVLMHPDHDHPNNTLIDAVIEHAPSVARVGEDPQRPGIMSRLDKDVSGLVVIAKTQHAFEHLKKQFAEHSVRKEYVALVYGEMEDEEGDIKFRIGRSSAKARMAAFPEQSTEGQAAWTHYSVMERFQDATLLALSILTGRTHQIRAHLFAVQHPIVGDPLYKPKRVTRAITSSRLLLQSIRLSFMDPTTNERRTFELPLDEAFKKTIVQLQSPSSV